MFGFGGGPDYDNPADDAMPYLEAIPGTVTPYYNPYINLGKGAARVSAPVYYQQITDPQGYYNDMMSGYQTSDAYKYNQQQAMAQQQAAANAGGFTGTSYDQANQAATTQGLLAQDQQRYYNNVTGAQQQGLNAGMHYFDTGYQASNTLAQMLGQNLAAEAGLQYQGTAFEDQLQAQQRQSRNSLLGTTLGVGFGYGNSGNNSYYQPYEPYDSGSSISGYSNHY
jgi:hypothetical protein